jgi:hypothetical protein
MKPPLPRTLSAVPQTSHVQLEIAKAIRTLAGPDDEELLRRRRAEIAALRSDLNALVRDIPKAFEAAAALAKAELRAALRKPAAGLTANLTFQRGRSTPSIPAGPPALLEAEAGSFGPRTMMERAKAGADRRQTQPMPRATAWSHPSDTRRVIQEL